jgi:predicted membrane protein (TIGR00267 family)
LRDVILGGQDGLVNVLGMILGVYSAGGDTRILIAAGLAATFAGAISMGAVAYTSALAERDHYLKELRRVMEEIRDMPQVEREEVRAIYEAQGFTGDLLERIIDTVTSNKEHWASIMMSEERHLKPLEMKEVLRTTATVPIATIFGSMVPIAPFIVIEKQTAIFATVAISALVLFILGAYEAKSFVGDWRKNGMRMVVIGLGGAFIGFMVGRFFSL